MFHFPSFLRAQVGQGVFDSYQLPDGRTMYFYHKDDIHSAVSAMFQPSILGVVLTNAGLPCRLFLPGSFLLLPHLQRSTFTTTVFVHRRPHQHQSHRICQLSCSTLAPPSPRCRRHPKTMTICGGYSQHMDPLTLMIYAKGERGRRRQVEYSPMYVLENALPQDC